MKLTIEISREELAAVGLTEYALNRALLSALSEGVHLREDMGIELPAVFSEVTLTDTELHLSVEEQQAVLQHPKALMTLVDHHSMMETMASAQNEDVCARAHQRRAQLLYKHGQRIIQEDPDIWPTEVVAEYKAP